MLRVGRNIEGFNLVPCLSTLAYHSRSYIISSPINPRKSPLALPDGDINNSLTVTISLVDISVRWLQYLVSKMEFTVLNSPKGFWRSLPQRSHSFLDPNLKTRLPTHWYPFPLHLQGLMPCKQQSDNHDNCISSELQTWCTTWDRCILPSCWCQWMKRCLWWKGPIKLVEEWVVVAPTCLHSL